MVCFRVFSPRPISIISSLPKIIVAAITQALSTQLLHKIVVQQHGFMKGQSTLTNLVTFNDFVSEALCNSSRVDAVYTDFSNIFDKVNHNLLLIKLCNITVLGNIFNVIPSYLSDRSQAVKLGNCFTSCSYYIRRFTGITFGPLIILYIY